MCPHHSLTARRDPKPEISASDLMGRRINASSRRRTSTALMAIVGSCRGFFVPARRAIGTRRASPPGRWRRHELVFSTHVVEHLTPMSLLTVAFTILGSAGNLAGNDRSQHHGLAHAAPLRPLRGSTCLGCSPNRDAGSRAFVAAGGTTGTTPKLIARSVRAQRITAIAHASGAWCWHFSHHTHTHGVARLQVAERWPRSGCSRWARSRPRLASHRAIARALKLAGPRGRRASSPHRQRYGGAGCRG